MSVLASCKFCLLLAYQPIIHIMCSITNVTVGHALKMQSYSEADYEKGCCGKSLFLNKVVQNVTFKDRALPLIT